MNVKIFHGWVNSENARIEERINTWLDKNSNIEIINIEQTMNSGQIVVISIFYEVKKEGGVGNENK